MIFGAVGGERGQPHRPPHLRRRAEPDPAGLSRQTFHFLLEGSPALEKLEMLQGGQVLDGCTGLS